MTGFTLVVILLFASIALPCEYCGHPGKSHPEMLASNDNYLIGAVHVGSRRYVVEPVVRFGADFRLRYDNGSQNDDRYDDESYRFRLNADFQLMKSLLLNTRTKLESQAGNDQDRVAEFDRIYLEYRKYKAEFGQLRDIGLTAKAGKMDSPFFRPGGLELMFDKDSSPEGLSLSADAYYDRYRIFTNAGHFDNQLAGLQSGFQFDVGTSEVTVGSGLYDYSQGMTVREVFGEISGILEHEITLSGQYAKTTEKVESWGIGMKLGKCDEPWESGEIYGQYYSTKAMVPTMDRDLLASSDRNGVIGANIAVADNTVFGVRYDESGNDWRVRSDLTLNF